MRKKINNVPIHSLHPTHTSKEDKHPKSVVLVHKVCYLKYKMWAKFVNARRMGSSL
jgi:hypothetical protein